MEQEQKLNVPLPHIPTLRDQRLQLTYKFVLIKSSYISFNEQLKSETIFIVGSPRVSDWLSIVPYRLQPLFGIYIFVFFNKSLFRFHVDKLLYKIFFKFVIYSVIE